MFNERIPQLADVHVRRAISYAIDRKALVKAVLFGHGAPANSFMPPQVPYYDKNSPGIQFDLTKAKQEMAQSKYPHGFSIALMVAGGNASERDGRPDPAAGAAAAGHPRHASTRSIPTSRTPTSSSSSTSWD